MSWMVWSFVISDVPLVELERRLLVITIPCIGSCRYLEFGEKKSLFFFFFFFLFSYWGSVWCKVPKKYSAVFNSAVWYIYLTIFAFNSFRASLGLPLIFSLLDYSCFAPTGRARFASLWGLANPRSRSQGDRRDKRPAYVSPYVHRKEGCRRREAATLSLRGLG